MLISQVSITQTFPKRFTKRISFRSKAALRRLEQNSFHKFSFGEG
jgi:hypothetical protein